MLIYSLFFLRLEFHVFVFLTCSLDKHWKQAVYKTQYAILAEVGVYVVYSTLALKLKGCSSRWNYNHQSSYRWCYWKMGFADMYVKWQLVPRVRRKVFFVYIRPSGWWQGSVEFSLYLFLRQLVLRFCNVSMSYFCSHLWTTFVYRRLPLDGQQNPKGGVDSSWSADFHCTH